MNAGYRYRLLERAFALPQADAADFTHGRAMPPGTDAALVRRIDETALRAKLIDARLAEGLQSPRGPQKIASIVRLYPDGDAPERAIVRRGGRGGDARPALPLQQGLPSVDEMAALIERFREVERDVAGELSAPLDARIAVLKRRFPDLEGTELESAHAELGEALRERKSLGSQIRYETFRRVEADTAFAPRVHLRLLARI